MNDLKNLNIAVAGTGYVGYPLLPYWHNTIKLLQ